jgi:hypothetical protein
VRGRPVEVTDSGDVAGDALREAARVARCLARPVRVRMIAGGVTTDLIADPHGQVSPLPDQVPPRTPDPIATGADPGQFTAAPLDAPTIPPPPSPARWYRAAATTAPPAGAPEPRRDPAPGPDRWGRQPRIPSPTTGSGAAPWARVDRLPVPVIPLVVAAIALVAVILISPRWTTSHTTANAAQATTPHPAASPPPTFTVPPMQPSPLAAATLPAAPPGYSRQPTWAHPIADGSLTAVNQTGTVITRSPDGHLIRIDAATGATTWSTAQTYGTRWAGPWLTTIDGHAAAALTTSTALAYWPLPEATGSTAQTVGAPTTVPLPAGATVTWTGPSPLITRGPGTAAVVDRAALHWVTVPDDARALAADGQDVIASAGSTWLRSQAGATTATVHQLPTPAGTSGPPVRVEAVSASYLLAAWPEPAVGAQTVTLIDVTSGQSLFQGALPAGIDITHGRLARQVTAGLSAIGALVVDPYGKRIDALDPTYRVNALTPGHVYATKAGHPSDIRLSSDGTFTVTPFPTGADHLIPFATTTTGGATTALVLTSSTTGRLLLALPAAG